MAKATQRHATAPGSVGPVLGQVPDIAPPRAGGSMWDDLNNGISTFVSGLRGVREAQEEKAYREAAAELAQRRQTADEEQAGELAKYRTGELGIRTRELQHRENELTSQRESQTLLVPYVEGQIEQLTGKKPAALPPGMRADQALRLRMDELNQAQTLQTRQTPTAAQTAGPTPAQQNAKKTQIRGEFQRSLGNVRSEKKSQVLAEGGEFAPGQMPVLSHADSVDAMGRTNAAFPDPADAGFLSELAKSLKLDGSAPPPADDVTPDDVKSWVDEAVQQGLSPEAIMSLARQKDPKHLGLWQQEINARTR